MPPISDIVKHLIIINVIMFVAFFLTLPNIGGHLAIYWPGDERFQPYQLVSHMFMHGSAGHLFFNMFGLYVFGSMVERYINPKRFLTLYFAAGFGAMVLHIAIQYYQHIQLGVDQFAPAVGASGALMGVVIAFAVFFPNIKLYLLFPPIPVKAKYLAIAYVAFDFFSAISGSSSQIAHWAHLGGAITGFFIASYWLRKSKR